MQHLLQARIVHCALLPGHPLSQMEYVHPRFCDSAPGRLAPSSLKVPGAGLHLDTGFPNVTQRTFPVRHSSRTTAATSNKRGGYRTGNGVGSVPPESTLRVTPASPPHSRTAQPNSAASTGDARFDLPDRRGRHRPASCGYLDLAPSNIPTWMRIDTATHRASARTPQSAPP